MSVEDNVSSPSSSSPSTPLSSEVHTPLGLHQNTIDPAAKWLVQKYGGTSVGKFAAKIAEDIVPYVRLSRRIRSSLSPLQKLP